MKPGWYAPVKGKFRARLAHFFIRIRLKDEGVHEPSLCRSWFFSKVYWQPVEGPCPKCSTCLRLERKRAEAE